MFGLVVPVFAFFVFMMFLQLLFVIFLIPETKGKSLEELGKELSFKNSPVEKILIL